jgi:hypothetical protein
VHGSFESPDLSLSNEQVIIEFGGALAVGGSSLRCEAQEADLLKLYPFSLAVPLISHHYYYKYWEHTYQYIVTGKNLPINLQHMNSKLLIY